MDIKVWNNMKISNGNRELVEQIRLEGIKNKLVLNAILLVDRANFVNEQSKARAYLNAALPIGAGQTISQPYVVARMTELLMGSRRRLSNVLEVGTGSGYQAAVLSKIADKVFTVERIEELYLKALSLFLKLNYNNIFCLYSDGTDGWKESAPYDGIIVTAACDVLPEKLLSQLSNGGNMVLPLLSDDGSYYITVLHKEGDILSKNLYDSVLFVPLLKGKE